MYSIGLSQGYGSGIGQEPQKLCDDMKVNI